MHTVEGRQRKNDRNYQQRATFLDDKLCSTGLMTKFVTFCVRAVLVTLRTCIVVGHAIFGAFHEPSAIVNGSAKVRLANCALDIDDI